MHVRTFLTLGSGEAMSRIVAFGAYIYLARVLGAEGYGIIAFAAGVNLYLAKIADVGVELVGASEVAKDRDAIPALGAALLTSRLLVAISVAAASAAVVQAVVPDPDRTVLTLYFLTLIPVALSTKWIHLGLESTASVGVWRVVGESLALALVVTFVHEMGDLWVVPLAVLAGDTLTNIALYAKLWTAGRGFGLRWDPDTARPILRRALPVMGQLVLVILLYNLDLFFLRAMLGAESVGYYAAAYTLISFLGNLGVAYGMSVLPAISRHGVGTEGERDLYHTALAQVSAVTLPIAVGGTFVAAGVIKMGFGDGYAQSAVVLQVLVWVIPLAVFRNVPWAALIARHREGSLLRATIIAVIANGFFNYVLIRSYGVVGAAFATLATEPIVAGLMLYYAFKEGLPVVSARRLWRPALATTLMGFALYGLGDTSVAIQLAVGAVVYAAALLLLGSIKFRGFVPVLEV